MRQLRHLFTVMSCVALLLGACSDDSGGADAGSADGAPVDVGTPDMVSATPCFVPCKADEGCVAVTVGRTSDDSKMPWGQFPGDADGFGDLRVVAYAGSTILDEGIKAKADYYQHSTTDYTVELCLPGNTTARVAAWLDDDGDSPAGATSSADYADSCCVPRSVEVTSVTGKRVSVAMQLKSSCD
jgi:hypothetical protein